MNDIVLTKKDLEVLRYIIKYSNVLNEKIENKTIPLNWQDVHEFCIKIGVNPKYL